MKKMFKKNDKEKQQNFKVSSCRDAEVGLKPLPSGGQAVYTH